MICPNPSKYGNLVFLAPREIQTRFVHRKMEAPFPKPRLIFGVGDMETPPPLFVSIIDLMQWKHARFPSLDLHATENGNPLFFKT